MKLLDERGIGTVWSICKEKFALVGHTHNYAGSGSPGGSANSAIGVVDYNQTDKTIQIGYSGTGITGDQIKYIAGYTDGGGNVNAKIKDVSKDALKSWLGLGSLAYSSSSIPTKLSQLNNDKGFVTGSVSGNTVTINGASTTWTNTWRGIQDNLTSSSTSDSLSANQGKVLKGLVDGKANSSHTHTWSQISAVPTATTTQSGIMSAADKSKLNGIASGANNYTLPVARSNTIGGIKVSPYYTGSLWPITIDTDDCAHTNIPGLNKNSQGSLSNVVLSSETKNTYYGQNGIDVEDRSSKQRINISFPTHSGTLAIASDIPDVSNLCRLNFINSISECVNGRINFLFKKSSEYIDLSFLPNLEEGTILFIYSPYVGFQITDKAGVWYYNGITKAADGTEYIDKAKLTLAFFYNVYNYVVTLSYD